MIPMLPKPRKPFCFYLKMRNKNYVKSLTVYRNTVKFSRNSLMNIQSNRANVVKIGLVDAEIIGLTKNR